jgi:hypothetical protein
LKHVAQSPLDTCVFASNLGAKLNHKPLKYKCLIKIHNQIKHVYLM